jgi:hypothetical protein
MTGHYLTSEISRQSVDGLKCRHVRFQSEPLASSRIGQRRDLKDKDRQRHSVRNTTQDSSTDCHRVTLLTSFCEAASTRLTAHPFSRCGSHTHALQAPSCASIGVKRARWSEYCCKRLHTQVECVCSALCVHTDFTNHETCNGILRRTSTPRS